MDFIYSMQLFLFLGLAGYLIMGQKVENIRKISGTGINSRMFYILILQKERQ